MENMNPVFELDSHSETQTQLNISEPVAPHLCDEELIQELNAIPQKMAFKIGEVAEMLDIKQYVLRYWESEFEELKPKKSKTNQRVFTRKDVENAFLIRKLLYRDRFSIEGARSALRSLKSQVKKEKNKQVAWDHIHHVKNQIDEVIQEIRILKEKFQF